MLVDDEKSYTDLMAQMIEEHLICKVAAFSRPHDALSALRAATPAVIVTDYHMPQLNGIEFIRLAAPLLPSTAFILITGHNIGTVQHEIDQLPPLKGVLSKPFGWRTLAAEIVRVWPDKLTSPKLPPAISQI